jgi:hypothetical protein
VPLWGPRGLDKLVTCVVERDGQRWSVVWMSDGKTPADFSEGSLSAAADRASAEVAAMYAGKPQAAAAELQFAIYPWPGKNPGKVILDITKDDSGLNAQDIQGTEIKFHSDSLDAVVADAERYLPNTGEAMLRWIRPIVELSGS